MNHQQAAVMADVVTAMVRMQSDPTVMRFKKLHEFARTMGLNLVIKNDRFAIQDSHGDVLGVFCTTEDINDWFKKTYLEDVL